VQNLKFNPGYPAITLAGNAEFRVSLQSPWLEMLNLEYQLGHLAITLAGNAEFKVSP
jgi:hypothetical protein